MVVQIEYSRIDTACRDTVEAALRSVGRNDLADSVPAGKLRIASDIAWLIEESATAFDNGRPLDGLTSAERALRPKWLSSDESREEYAGAILAVGVEVVGVPV